MLLLSEEDMEKAAAATEPVRNCVIVVERLQPIAIALKRGLEMVDDLMHHFFEVDYFKKLKYTKRV